MKSFRMYDIIDKKKLGQELSDDEIAYFVKGFTNGEIPDYQASALCMAIYFNGMSDREISTLTLEMRDTGDIVDLSAINGIKVDKHSTGGVGDKVTMIAAPIVASVGVPIAKMSGRGLGFTGGTADKLESIPGFNINLDSESFFKQVNEIGIAIATQTGNLCPADKKLYALRDVTATVDSLPLIASSIMSKKLAAGCDKILLDVTVGSGAFMKTRENAQRLADTMVNIGKSAGKETVAVITDMDTPLGRAVGNSLEVIEAVEMLKGNAPDDLRKVVLEISANMIYLGEKAKCLEEAYSLAENAISSGKALEKFKQMVAYQGGDISYIDDLGKFKMSPIKYEIKAATCGYVQRIDALSVGNASMILGAGREKKGDSIDFGAGIYLNKKQGEKVFKGDTVMTLYSQSLEKCKKAEEALTGVWSVESGVWS